MGLMSHLSDDYNTFFSYHAFFYLDIESNKYVFDDESDNDGSGSGFTIESGLSASCPFLEISVDRVCGLSCNGVTKYVCQVSGIFSV